MSSDKICFTKEEFGRGSEYLSKDTGLHYFFRNESLLCVSVIAAGDITMFVRPIRSFSEYPVSDERLADAVSVCDQKFMDILANYELETEDVEERLSSDFVSNDDGTTLLALKYPFLYEMATPPNHEDSIYVVVGLPPQYESDNDFFRGFVLKDFLMVGNQKSWGYENHYMTLDEAYSSIVKHAHVFGTLLEGTILN